MERRSAPPVYTLMRSSTTYVEKTQLEKEECLQLRLNLRVWTVLSIFLTIVICRNF